LIDGNFCRLPFLDTISALTTSAILAYSDCNDSTRYAESRWMAATFEMIYRNFVALSLRDRKAGPLNNADEAFGNPVAERHGYFHARKQRLPS
jgi:hypothetical protein